MSKHTPQHSRQSKSVLRPWQSQMAAFALACVVTIMSGLSASAPAHGAQRLPGSQDGSPAVPSAGGAERGSERPDRDGSETPVRRTRNPNLFVEPGLAEQLAAGESADLLIHFGNLPDFEPFYRMDWQERGRALYDTMEAIRRATQGPVIEELRSRGIDFRSHWVGNNMEVYGVDHDTFIEIVTFESVHAVVFNPEHFLIEPEEPFGAGSEQTLGGPIIEPNLTWVGAPDAWAQGIRGQDVVVGLNDSSPRFTHNLLVGAYRGNQGGGMFNHQYNWFDPNTGSAQPFPESHGTHVLGLMIGDDGSRNTGMAPDAKWMACGGCAGGSCAGVLTCLNWFPAPTDQSGANPDPDLRPHVVNNSWGNCLTTYQDTVYEPIWDTLYAAGVMPFFANGNASNCSLPNHPGLNTVGNPARGGRVIGVGSTAQSGGTYASHSLWGPTDNPNPGGPTSFDHFGFPLVKPNVVAPGQGVVSAGSASDTAFVPNTGTSMASPHVTGFAALLISACPLLAGNHQMIGTIMMSTADHRAYDGGTSGQSPDVAPGVNHPNFGTGWGEINVPNAVAAAQAFCGPTGTLSGVVTDADTSQTLQGVQVAIPNPSPPPDHFNTNTGAGGAYSRVLPEGNYQVTFSRFGYISQEHPVTIEEDETFELDVALQAAELVLVTGRISDAQTGWGLHARISFSDAPLDPVFSDPLTGNFSVNLPEQGEFDVTVESLVPGYLTGNATLSTIGPLGGGNDIALDVDEVACAAPGYEAVGFLFEGFEDTTFPPPGWTKVKTAGGGDGTRDWNRVTTSANSGVASAFRNWSGSADGFQDDWLVSPPIDFDEIDSLSFFERTGDLSFYVRNDLMVSEGSCDPSDGEFVSLQEIQGNDTWRLIEQDLSAFSGTGCVAFRYQGTFAHIWWVDDVRFAGPDSACLAPPGALLFGQVVDANTMTGLNGAAVEIVGGSSHVSAASPDPAYEGVFYAYLDAEPLADAIFADGFESPEGPLAGSLRGANGSRTWTVTAELDPYHPDEETVEAFPGGNSGVLLALTAGRLTVEPAELTETTEYLQTSSRNLALINDGTAPVTFDVSIETEVIPVVSADFEGSVPPAGWTVNSLGGAAPCVWRRNDDLVTQTGAPAAPRANFAGGDGFSAAADSDRCGSGSTMDTELVSPVIDFSSLADPSLEFVLSFRVLGESRLDIDVSTDAGDNWTTIQSYTASVSATGPGTPQSFSLNAFGASSEGRIRFRYVAPGWHWWAQVDQVRIGGQAQWLTVTPGDGTFNVPADATGQLLSVGFDATQVPGPGTYNGKISIANDTPYDGGLVEVPVTFHVTPAPGQSRLEGSVSGLGYCDAENYPAAGASVNVIGQNNTFGLTADEDGAFGLWLDTSEAPLTIEVAAAGHVGQTDGGVGLGSQQTTTRHYNLRLDAPCGSVSPDSVSTSQDPNTTSIVQVVLRNDGAAQLDWTEGTGSQNVLVLEQTDNAANGIVSSRFLGLNPVTGAYSADDFAFGGGGISSIRVDGFRSGGGSIALTATELAFYIYPDAGGVPAGHPEDGGGTESWSFAAAPNHPAFSIGPDSRITLNVVAADGQPVQLSPGHYWVVAYATVPGTEGSTRWNWFATAAGQATGFDAQIITPGAAFGGGFPDWASIAEGVDPVFAGLGLRIDSQLGCSTIANTVDGSGSVGPDGVAIVSIEVDTTGVPPGNYDEIVCLLTNDAQAELITVAVALEVTMPASFGTLEGTITSSGYCDLASDPIDGADIEIAGQTFTFNTSSGPDGGYSISVDSLDGPYTVTANASEHLQGQSVGVIVNAGATTVEDLELRLDAPCASADPTSLSASAASGTSTAVDLDIINSGAAAFDWAIAFEEEVALLGGGPIDVVQDGGFEAGSPNPFWDEASTNFGTPLCTVADCGFGGGTGPRTGTWWAWFGGIAAAETGSVAQDVTIPPATSAELRFWLEIPASATPGFLEVRMGGDVVFSVTQADAGSFGTYTEVVVDMLAYADGVERELLFFSQTTAGATTNFFVDDVSLVVEPGGTCVSPEGVDWLSADPATGTTAGDDTDTVSITFDASTLDEGSYEATLCLSTTDAQNPLIVIPVEFEVTEGTPLPSVSYSFGGFDALIDEEEGIVSVNVQAANFDPATPVRYLLTLLDGNDDPVEGQGFDFCIDGEDCTDREAIPPTDVNGEAFFGPENGVPAGATGILDPGGATNFFAVTLAAGEYQLGVQLLDVTDTGDPQNLGSPGNVDFEVAVPPPPPVVIDIAGQESPSILCGDGTNPALPSINVDIGANTPVLTVAWDTLLETNGTSWASEAAILFGTTSTRFEVSLRPGVGTDAPTPPGGTQFAGGPIDLVGPGFDFAVEADGLLWLTFCETFNDGADPDAFWLNPSTITVNAPLGGLAPEGAAAALSRTLSHPGGK